MREIERERKRLCLCVCVFCLFGCVRVSQRNVKAVREIQAEGEREEETERETIERERR